MPDRFYEVQADLPRSYRRRAVWFSIAGAFNWQTARRDPPRAHRGLRRLWFGRLATLREAGWKRVQTVALQWLRNCPPAGLWAPGTPMRACTEKDLCPFCWGRLRTEKFYGYLERWSRLAPEAPKGMRWCLFRWTRPEKKPERLDNRAQLRALRRSGAVAGVVLQTWMPVKPGGVWSWKLRRSGVVLMRGAGDPDLGPGGQLKTLSASKLPRRQVYRAALYCAGYPRGLLTCPASMCLEMLRVCDGSRGLRKFGRVPGEPERDPCLPKT